jgi:hypothetical protein
MFLDMWSALKGRAVFLSTSTIDLVDPLDLIDETKNTGFTQLVAAADLEKATSRRALEKSGFRKSKEGTSLHFMNGR